MKTQIKIGSIAAFLCFVMPFLSRLPRGIDWVAQYLPDEGHLLIGTLLIGTFAMVPAVAVFCAALLSKPPFYFPVLLGTLVATIMLAYWHHDLDLTTNANAPIALVIIPIYATALGVAGGVIGFGLQHLTQRLKLGTEQGVDPNA